MGAKHLTLEAKPLPVGAKALTCWGKTLNIIWMEDGEMKIRQEPVEAIRDDLEEALNEVKAMIAERAAEAGGEK